jgi:hypothetical protein
MSVFDHWRRPWQFSDGLCHIVGQGAGQQPVTVGSEEFLAIVQAANESLPRGMFGCRRVREAVADLRHDFPFSSTPSYMRTLHFM